MGLNPQRQSNPDSGYARYSSSGKSKGYSKSEILSKYFHFKIESV